MNNIWGHSSKNFCKCAVNCGMPVAVPRPRHVDDVKRNTRVSGVGSINHDVLGKESVFLSRENMHLMVFGKRLGKALGINLGPRVVQHWVAVNDLQDLH